MHSVLPFLLEEYIHMYRRIVLKISDNFLMGTCREQRQSFIFTDNVRRIGFEECLWNAFYMPVVLLGVVGKTDKCLHQVPSFPPTPPRAVGSPALGLGESPLLPCFTLLPPFFQGPSNPEQVLNLEQRVHLSEPQFPHQQNGNYNKFSLNRVVVRITGGLEMV